MTDLPPPLFTPVHSFASSALTPREAEVHALMRSGARNQEVANRLNIHVRLANRYRARVMAKIGIVERQPAVHVEPAYHYEEAYHQCRDRMQENSGFLVALSINPAFPVPAIGAVLGVTAECVRRRLRLVGMTRKRGARTGANHYKHSAAWLARQAARLTAVQNPPASRP